jgi:hypothetical protein
MPINLGSGSGTMRPYLRFSPQANAWMKSADGGAVEFDPKSSAMAIDVERMQLGWLHIAEGERDWQPWPSMTKRTPKPEGEYKVGFIVQVYAPKLLGEEVHDFSSNATASTRFVEDIYNALEKDFGKGQVPLIQVTGSKPIKIGKGTTREIEWKLVRWMDRPKALDEVEAPSITTPEEPSPFASKAMAPADGEEF